MSRVLRVGPEVAIWVWNTKALEQLGLHGFHLLSLDIVLVIPALGVQRTVYDQMRQMMVNRFVLLGRLCLNNSQADQDIGLRRRTDQALIFIFNFMVVLAIVYILVDGVARIRKGQHIGRVVLIAKLEVQGPTLGLAHKSQC